MIVAVSRNRVIGNQGQLPWRLPEDLKHFKRITLGHALLMGRRTFDSIGKPLPKRRNIVLSTSLTSPPRGVELARTLEDALRLAYTTDPLPFIIGGASLYAEALPQVTRIYLTKFNQEVDGDTLLPEFDCTTFREVERRAGSTPDLSFLTMERFQ